jgi:hypothetical protein
MKENSKCSMWTLKVKSKIMDPFLQNHSFKIHFMCIYYQLQSAKLCYIKGKLKFGRSAEHFHTFCALVFARSLHLCGTVNNQCGR